MSWILNALHFSCLIDVFESLICWLDLWLSSLLDCIHFYVFLLFEKLFLSSLTTSRQIFDKFVSLSLFFFLSQQKLTQSRSIKVSRFLLDSFSIHRETLCLVNRSSTNSRSIEIGFCSIAAQQMSRSQKETDGDYQIHLHIIITAWWEVSSLRYIL